MLANELEAAEVVVVGGNFLPLKRQPKQAKRAGEHDGSKMLVSFPQTAVGKGVLGEVVGILVHDVTQRHWEGEQPPLFVQKTRVVLVIDNQLVTFFSLIRHK